MYQKFKDEFKNNKRVRLAIFLLPLIFVVAVYNFFDQILPMLKGSGSSASQKELVENQKLKSKITKNKKNNIKIQANKLSSQELKKALKKLQEENRELTASFAKFSNSHKNYFWRADKHGDAIKKLPSMIEVAAKKFDLKIKSLSGINQRKLTNELQAVKLSVNLSGDYFNLLKFIAELENNSPQIVWNRSRLRTSRHDRLFMNFSAEVNVMLLKDKDIEAALDGSINEKKSDKVKQNSKKNNKNNHSTSRRKKK